MASVEARLSKLREERIAREKARIEKLRELNLKKYNGGVQPTSSSSSSSVASTKLTNGPTKNVTAVKNVAHINGSIKKPATNKTVNYVKANKNVISHTKNKNTSSVNGIKGKLDGINDIKPNMTDDNKFNIRKKNPLQEIVLNKDGKIPKITVQKVGDPKQQKTAKNITNDSKKTMKNEGKNKTVTNKRESVFDRLYKPKIIQKETVNNVLKLHTDPGYLNKVIKDSKMITSRRHTTFEKQVPVRRSISAVHFKRIRKSELPKCVHKWASIGEKIDKTHLEDINEDADCDSKEKIVSAVKSERKKVKFQTPNSFNTPRPDELQSRLVSWLQRRGKSVESYHHLQCFGVHHLPKPALNFDASKLDSYDDDDKENIALDHDSDNESFHNNMNNRNCDAVNENKVEFPVDKWRRASYFSDSVDLNDTRETNTSCGTVHHQDELLLGALNDLTELLREGFEWEQCARWLRAIREQFPGASDTAAYWECRAALEERRGDLPASLHCWEQAVASGTKESVAEANLDNLLDKFMQLKISPTSGKTQMDPKLVDVKSVFKSTIIRFGVQQAKLRQSTDPVRYTVTPVRRSARLSVCRHTPLRVCSTLKEASEIGPIEFVPNKALVKTP
ncbi:hypothetical protein KGM_202686 [Danaus plexippus plexippus]|uniref:Uncharacterized protein n=1 Tax=Danaus plexippus plexippus TaxID=278856 RepID=A0A212EXZ6_DANPL|nr:hypothetical protein KGM_202686 [Danaus plexippus plexippus]